MSQDKVCMETREEFSALLDEELTPEERERVESHLSECSECLRELNALKRVDDAYGALPEVMAPKGFEKRVRGAARPRRRIRPIVWVGPVLAAAATVLVVLSGVFEQDTSDSDRFQTALQSDYSTRAAARTAPEADAVEPRFDDARKKQAIDSPLERKEEAADRQETLVMEEAAISAAPELESMTDEQHEALESLGYIEEEPESRQKSADQDRRMSAAATSRNRREVLGEPKDAERSLSDDPQGGQLAPSSSGVVQLDTFDVSAEEMNQMIDTRNPAGRTSLRSFRVRDDDVWVERTYAGEATIALKRGSKELADLTALDREVLKIARRSNACIFLVAGKWYHLKSEPELDEAP